MRSPTLRSRVWLVFAGLLLGCAAGVGTASVVAAAGAQPAAQQPAAVFDATHLPPLLTRPGERVELAYDVHCASADAGDVDRGCDARGRVFVRPAGGGSFHELPLTARTIGGIRQLALEAPASLLSHRTGFEYYAVLEAPELDRTITLPAGGAAAPHVSRPLENSVEIALGRHRFGRTRAADARVASARWGSGSTDVGLERGPSSSPAGASAFDVDSAGTVVILDQAHRRLLRWSRGGQTPQRTPLSLRGTIADLAAANDGSLYVLESVAERGRHPLVRRFDHAGRELEAVEIAEHAASQIRSSPKGPLVLAQPSHHWLPVTVDGAPAPRAEQLARGRAGRAMRNGAEVVVYRWANELRIAVISGQAVTRAWRLTSETPLADVQLAELAGQRLVVVVRVYDEPVAEFAVLVLGRSGLEQRFALDTEEWAEAAPLGRFKLAGRSLYRLGSSPAGAFVDRFDLEVQ